MKLPDLEQVPVLFKAKPDLWQPGMLCRDPETDVCWRCADFQAHSWVHVSTHSCPDFFEARRRAIDAGPVSHDHATVGAVLFGLLKGMHLGEVRVALRLGAPGWLCGTQDYFAIQAVLANSEATKRRDDAVWLALLRLHGVSP